MCGIAGFFLPGRTAETAAVRAMCDRIRHRGPDDEGFRVEDGCAIGMRRLSIIDLATGHQPISNEDGSVWIVFNGEIYNYGELRRDLIGRGHRFTTNSDTETLIHLYEEEGTEGLHRLRGMFAYAIWDGRQRKLLLVRDRFGKKPLYYAIRPEGIYFASELKCLREFELPFDLDQEALRLYFFLGYIPDPSSPFQSIRKLMPGSWLTYSATGVTAEGRYWNLPVPAEQPAPSLSPADLRIRLRDKFDESVRIRMMADVPLGAFLSGGIDSSSVVASMALQSSEPVKTFSIGFEEAAFNELPYASLVAKKYRTEHQEIVVRPDCVDLVTRLVRHFDEPFGDSSAIPTFIVSKFAARSVKVALTGDGGDELFAGYESFFLIDGLRRFDAVPQAARRAISWLAERLPYSAYGKNYLHMISRPTALDRYFELNHAPWFLRRQMLTPGWMLPAEDGYLRKRFTDFLPAGEMDVLTQALYFEATAKLTGDMLVKVDRMSMANSLEVRSPFLDHELAELAATIPHSWKMAGGKGKAVLIDAIGDRLPPELLHREKMGFAVPLALWFRGSLREFLNDHLAERFTRRGLTSGKFVAHLIEEHQRGRRDNSHWLWRLLMLELWFRDWESELGTSPHIAAAAHQIQPRAR